MRNRVLIVDDELFFLEAIDEILTAGGYETVRAENGGEALEKIADPRVSVVVLDVRLPDMDGISVLAKIRGERPELPVIMLSASTDQEIVLEALRLGASDYLAKPLHEEELVLAVGRGIDGHEASSGRRRLRARIDRLVESMERLSQLVRWAAPADRADVLRTGIVDAAAVVFQAARVSLMLADEDREWLTVVACRGIDVERETLSPRKVGEGASGRCFAEGSVLCVSDVALDPRFAGRGAGAYRDPAFAVVPLVCLGEPVGVLCLTDGDDEGGFRVEEANVLRLLGMQVSEFLAADPEVERILEAANTLEAEGVTAGGARPGERSGEQSGLRRDPDAELARAICEAVAAEVEPARVLRMALSSVSHILTAGPVALYLHAPDGVSLVREAEVDGSVAGDRERLPSDRGLTGTVCLTGGLVAVEDPASDARFDPQVDTAADGVARAMLCVPIKLRDKGVGVLRVFFEPGSRPSPRTAEVLSAAFSAAVRNILLYRSLLQSIEELATARREARGDRPTPR